LCLQFPFCTCLYFLIQARTSALPTSTPFIGLCPSDTDPPLQPSFSVHPALHPPSALLGESKEPQPAKDQPTLDDSFPGDPGDIFEKLDGFNLNPLPTIQLAQTTGGTTWEPEVNYYDADSYSKEPVWFDMAY
jgi:hypothetical protein